jgi:hypothetical protein
MFVDVFCRFFAVHQRQLSSGFAPNSPSPPKSSESPFHKPEVFAAVRR